MDAAKKTPTWMLGPVMVLASVWTVTTILDAGYEPRQRSISALAGSLGYSLCQICSGDSDPWTSIPAKAESAEPAMVPTDS